MWVRNRQLSGSVFLATFGAVVLATAVAGAQEVQTYEFQGWTATGNETVSRVTYGKTGLSDSGDPINWRYTVLELASARSGEVIGRFKVGTAEGNAPRAWQEAKAEASGNKRVKALGLIDAIETPVSPNGTLAVVTISTESTEEGVVTAECPGCNRCTTTTRTFLIHGDGRRVYTVSEHDATGNPYPPDDPVGDCPVVSARTYWHPQSDRFAVVLGRKLKSAGSESEDLSVHVPRSGVTRWPYAEVKVSARGPSDADTRIAQLKRQLRDAKDASDKTLILSNLGDAARTAGDYKGAEGYYSSALSFDKNNLRALIGTALIDVANGNQRKATRTMKTVIKRDKRKNQFTADIGLYYLATGDTGRAEKYLQSAVDSGGEGNFAQRLDLGHRILDADLTAGMAYLDNLLSSVPDNLPNTVKARLVETYIRLAEVGVQQRDFALAADFVSRLDKKTDEAKRLALLVAASRPGNSRQTALAYDRATALLDSDPTRCELYFVRGMALRRLRRPHEMFANFAAAVVCNPAHTEAHYYLAEMFSLAGNFDRARTHYQAFLEMAPPRRGDLARTLRRQRVTTLLPRLSHNGVILISHDCEPKGSGIICRGVVTNRSRADTGPVEVRLTAATRGRRAKTIGTQSANLASMPNGASRDFSVILNLNGEDPASLTIELTAGRSEAERKVNATEVDAR